MPIAFDAVGTARFNPASAGTYSHVTSGNNRELVVGIGVATGDDVIGTVTYNAVSLTLGTQVQLPGTIRRVYIWRLTNPTTGTNNVIISSSASVDIMAVSASYTGVAQSGQPDAGSTATSTIGSIIGTVTTIAVNAWAIACTTNDQDNIAAGAGQTMRGSVSVTGIGDSNSDITPAGAYTMQTNRQGAGNANWGMALISLAPVALVAEQNARRSLLGVGL